LISALAQLLHLIQCLAKSQPRRYGAKDSSINSFEKKNIAKAHSIRKDKWKQQPTTGNADASEDNTYGYRPDVEVARCSLRAVIGHRQGSAAPAMACDE